MANLTKAEAESFKAKLNEESGRSKNVESDRDILKAQIMELRKVSIYSHYQKGCLGCLDPKRHRVDRYGAIKIQLTVEPPVATIFVSDHFSSATSFPKYQKFSSKLDILSGRLQEVRL